PEATGYNGENSAGFFPAKGHESDGCTEGCEGNCPFKGDLRGRPFLERHIECRNTEIFDVCKAVQVQRDIDDVNMVGSRMQGANAEGSIPFKGELPVWVDKR